MKEKNNCLVYLISGFRGFPQLDGLIGNEFHLWNSIIIACWWHPVKKTKIEIKSFFTKKTCEIARKSRDDFTELL